MYSKLTKLELTAQDRNSYIDFRQPMFWVNLFDSPKLAFFCNSLGDLRSASSMDRIKLNI